jgi:hypothetical protein
VHVDVLVHVHLLVVDSHSPGWRRVPSLDHEHVQVHEHVNVHAWQIHAPLRA